MSESNRIAVIGMSCRFPGAADVEAYWRNLAAAAEAVEALSDGDLRRAGVPSALSERPEYVRAGSFLDDPASFDADYFGFTARQALATDPQLRILLECALEAMERSGHPIGEADGLKTGIYAGASLSHYFHRYVLPKLGPERPADYLFYLLANDKDHLATTVAYRLGFTGPAVNVQTACSSSLVAIHLACQDLLSHQCDLVLAGGVTVRHFHKEGYLWESESILSRDGHCRPFAAGATGTIFGNGAGVVALRRLEDAVEDGDPIHAVILGSAVNNDGRRKVGYSAPSVQGQAEVIAWAQSVADVSPETIGYVEAHGTGTELGDPVEVEALTQVFREKTAARQFCALGAVKSNIGHTECASGVAGFIKAVLALEREAIPPTLNFDGVNPHIDLEHSPFFVNTDLRPWPIGDAPRRAAVSSFGMGGTNAHVILEEAPRPDVSPSAADGASPQLLTLSARNAEALAELRQRYAAHLRERPTLPLGDVCFTSQVGRTHLPHREIHLASNLDELLRSLESGGTAGRADGTAQPVLLFPGQGVRYEGLGRALYARHRAFREALDRCDRLLRARGARPIAQLLWPERAGEGEIETENAQPAIFCLSWALAELWRSWGVEPSAVAGHSVGEISAACVAGIFSLEDALDLILARARLMQATPPGSMWACFAEEERVVSLLPGFPRLGVAAVNGPALTVVSGEPEMLARFVEQATREGLRGRSLSVSRAFHSPLMADVRAKLRRVAERITYHRPAIHVVEALSGSFVQDQMSGPDYWCDQVLKPVRFLQMLRALGGAGHRLFLEAGPGSTLSALGRQCETSSGVQFVVSARPDHPEEEQILRALGALYLAGVPVRWEAVHDGGRRRVVLPTYPFQRRRYFLEAPAAPAWERPRPADDRALGARMFPAESATSSQRSFVVTVDPRDFDYLRDHRIEGMVVLPGTFFLEMAAAVGHAVFSGGVVMEDVAFLAPLSIGVDPIRLHIDVDEPTGDRAPFRIWPEVPGRRARPIVEGALKKSSAQMESFS